MTPARAVRSGSDLHLWSSDKSSVCFVCIESPSSLHTQIRCTERLYTDSSLTHSTVQTWLLMHLVLLPRLYSSSASTERPTVASMGLNQATSVGKSTNALQPSAFRQQWQQCGSWQKGYRKLHFDIVTGNAAQQYIVAQPHSGLADSLSCISTLLYIAVLTDQALLVQDFGSSATILSYGYDQPNIAWAAHPEVLDSLPSAYMDGLTSDGQELQGQDAELIR